jgi:hypothetical protein
LQNGWASATIGRFLECVKIGLELHAQYSQTPEGLDRIDHLVD